MKREIVSGMVIAAALGLCGCKSMQSPEQQAAAVATLNPATGSNVRGKIFFIPDPGGVRVVGEVTGLTPGDHGFHIHEKGDCSAPDATSAGGHYNPSQSQHGAPTDMARHAGDFGNIVADNSGVAKFAHVDKVIKLDGPNSIIGKAVIVHGKADDLKSQPAGNAGPRVACGVVEKR
jgi:superoxide dismutase, Cu-Zn family